MGDLRDVPRLRAVIQAAMTDARSSREEEAIEAILLTAEQEVPAALEAARRAAGAGRYTLEECRRMAETYRGGDGNHPLARHRDSMG